MKNLLIFIDKFKAMLDIASLYDHFRITEKTGQLVFVYVGTAWNLDHRFRNPNLI